MEGVSTYYKSDSGYPEILRVYQGMPEKIYVRGSLPDPSRPTVAIVGARNCTAYGRNQAERYARVLSEHGVQIISGLALGVDAAAHRGCIQGGTPTYAVLGCGINICYPKENYQLLEQILSQGGGLLSEFEPGDAPLGWHFARRNRVISALADLVLVVEARERSGSLITADYALEQGKTIYAIPGRVSDRTSAGCNRLIAQGAGIAWCPEKLLDELGLGAAFLPGEEEKVIRSEAVRISGSGELLELICDEAKSFAVLLAETGKSSGELSRDLMLLLLDGQIQESPPGYYSKKM